jgi:hypothetical protein
VSAVLKLVLARARRRPGRFVTSALGLAVAIAFGGVVLAEATIAGDQAARRVLDQASPLTRAVSVDWLGPGSPAVAAQARGTLARLGLTTEAEAVVLSPVRLSGAVVRLAAVSPLAGWLLGQRPPGPCRASSCPMLLAGGGRFPRTLSAPGVRVPVLGAARLRSAAPLGFSLGAGQPEVFVTGDLAGLNGLSALAGLPRTHSWVSVLDPGRLNSWTLPQLENRLQRAQLELTATANNYDFTAPFDTLDAARAGARAAAHGLLLSGGGALAALAVFVLLAGAALRTEMRAELGRLHAAGGRAGESAALALLEAGWIGALAVLIGAAAAVGVAAVLAGAAGVPSGGAITHSLLTGTGAAAAAGAWISATVLLALLIGLPRGALVTVADALAVAGLAALISAFIAGVSSGDAALLLAPLACVTAGLLLVRGMGAILRLGERVARRAPPLARVAALGLARGPGLPSVAVAFIAISVGLGGFALSYRATLERSAADQAADRVPLDALVSPGANFATPLQVAPLSHWRALAGGPVLAVRRTEASYPRGGQTITETALGIPAAGLDLIHGWRASDARAPLRVLARRLVAAGPLRKPGPILPSGARRLVIPAVSPAGAVEVTADLRSGDGLVDQVPLGAASPTPATLGAPIPAGHWELESLELDQPTGVQALTAHQNGEGPTAAPTTSGPVRLGRPAVLDGRHRRLAGLDVGGWTAVGAARPVSSARGGLVVRFASSGEPGVLRPPQPSDRRALPVLADPQTAAAAGPHGSLPLTVDGQPMRARVVGVLRRFPTLPAGGAGFVIADEATLAAALEAEQPGQGRPDELWLSSDHLGRLRAALAGGSLAQLQSAFRVDIERELRDDPAARAVLGTLVAAAAVSLALALAGVQAVLLGSVRDARLERDLAGLGIGPRGLKAELRMRLATAALTGTLGGIVVAILLTGLTVAGVGSVLGTTTPAVIAVVPVGGLALWALVALGALALAAWVATIRVRRPV